MNPFKQKLFDSLLYFFFLGFFVWQGVVGLTCNYFIWFDPLMCARSIVVIPDLLKKIRDLEEQVYDMELKLCHLNERGFVQSKEGKK